MTDTAHEGPAPHEADRAAVTNLGLDGLRDVGGQPMTHPVLDEHVVRAR